MHFFESFCIVFYVYLIHFIAADYGSSWGEKYPNCNGENQSPIDLDDIERIYNNTISFNFEGYDVVPDSMTVKNNGHTAEVKPRWNNTKAAFVKDGVRYEVEQLHFHWGSSNFEGSEHTFKDKKTTLEMHIVHWNPDLGDFDGSEGNGILVLGILYEFSEDDDVYSDSLFKILNYTSDIEEPKSEPVDIEPFALKLLIDDNDSEEFLTYNGSLTTPPCTEGVTWCIFNSTSPVNKKEMSLFRSIKFSDGDDHNNRPIQKANDRTLTAVKRTDL